MQQTKQIKDLKKRKIIYLKDDEEDISHINIVDIRDD